MRIGIFDPYLNTLGGGERYVLTIAECLAKEHEVEVFWDEQKVLRDAEKRFNLDLQEVTVSSNIFNKEISTLSRLNETKKYDVLFYLSDGSIPLLTAKRNILLLQHPVNWVNGKTVKNRLKLSRIHTIVSNSKFVKEYLDQTFSKKSQVLYPPVELYDYSEIKKKNIILTVGRFTKAMNAKNQEVLLETFKKLYQNGLKDWELIIAGSYLEEDKDFVTEIKNNAKGFPVTIAANAPYSDLQKYYQKAKIYWHAAGYGENIREHPERTEHFGITTVEAMSAGAVPIVFNAGGQKEIVSSGVDGFRWNTIEELIDQTEIIIKSKEQRVSFAANAVEHARNFSKELFYKNVEDLVNP